MESLHLSLDEADLLVEALDAYSRLCMGQLEIAEEAIRHDLWRGSPDGVASRGAERGMEMAKAALGHPSGGSFGIRHETVDISAKRTWEVMKAVRRALELHRDPAGEHRTVHRDGLTILRCTNDAEPEASVADGRLAVAAEPDQWDAVAKALEVHRAVRTGDMGVIVRLAEEGFLRARENVGTQVTARTLKEGDPALDALHRAVAFAQDHVALAGKIGAEAAVELAFLEGGALAFGTVPPLPAR